MTATQPAPTPTTVKARRRPKITSYGTVIGMIVVVLAVGAIKPSFLGLPNLQAVLVEATVLAVLAVGLSIVMSMKGIDLSIAVTADVAGYIAAKTLLEGNGLGAALFAALAVGLVVGLVNGVLAGFLGVPAIVATLGVNLLLSAVGLVISDNGTPQQLFTAPAAVVGDFLAIGTGSVGPVRILIIVAIVVVAIAWFATRRTVWGRGIDLVESSSRAAFLAGVPVRVTFAAGFVACSVLAALAGVMLTARTGVVVPGTAAPLLLDAFTAVYLGSIASPKGRIRVLWTVVGALFVALLANGLTLLGLGAPWRFALNGLLILAALALGALRTRTARR
ncbi:ABC transporter permease [Amnibacterium flavum]|nr:ABC transporter permease [Amnibacterium flavum]